MSSKLEKKIWQLVEPLALGLGYEIYDVEYVKEGPNWYLRIMIDIERGINIDDCQSMSEKVSEILDVEDPIDSHYILEVSSPGVERILKREKDFLKYIGNEVSISTYAPIDGKKTFQGENRNKRSTSHATS